MVDNSDEKLNNKPSTRRGGARPGAGRKPGKMEAATIKRLRILEAYKAKVQKAAGILFLKQMALAQGVSYLYKIQVDENGKRQKPKLVTDTKEIEDYLMEQVETDGYFFVHTERPDSRTIDSMLDRTFGKAPGKLDVTSDGKEIQQPVIISPVAPRNVESQTEATDGS
jgi:hypothetical protein